MPRAKTVSTRSVGGQARTASVPLSDDGGLAVHVAYGPTAFATGEEGNVAYVSIKNAATPLTGATTHQRERRGRGCTLMIAGATANGSARPVRRIGGRRACQDKEQ